MPEPVILWADRNAAQNVIDRQIEEALVRTRHDMMPLIRVGTTVNYMHALL